jgi:hypothetical protein
MESRSRTEQNGLADMSEKELHDLWKRLRLFTYKRFGKRTKGVRGINLDEVILDAIEDTFFGKRRWPPLDDQGHDKQISLFFFLCQTIRSKVSHIIEHEKKKQSINEEDTESLNQKGMYKLQASEQTDAESIYNQLSNRIRQAVKSDPLLKQIVELWIADPDLKPKDIARNLKVKDETIRNAQKRLNRKIKDIRAKWSNDYER